MKKLLTIIGCIFAIVCAIGSVGYVLDEKIKILSEKIDSIDDAVFQHMKDEFNARSCMKTKE